MHTQHTGQIPAISRWLVRCYPRAWRRRYEVEFVATLAQCRPTLRQHADVLRGVADAWLHQQAILGRYTRMNNPLRQSALTVFCAWIAFVLAGMGYQK